MSINDIRHAADYFWDQVGSEEPFPRSLEISASCALPVAIVKLPRLWVGDVQAALLRYGVQWSGPAVTTCLRGLMLAARGKGFLLLDGGDPPDEQRYSLAHEVAHFLLDYYLPRLDAVSKLGPKIVEVLDGDRSPTLQERVHAALSAAHIGTYEHMGRRRQQLTAPDREDAADALAVELLAPSSEVWQRVQRVVPTSSATTGSTLLRLILADQFGLPSFAAAGTADLLVRRWWPPPAFRDWMGIEK